jgi:hypothetical protein
MIEITCPQCQSELQIDQGFAGGICRCFNCGTLMTVPQDHEQQSPEAIRQARPDRPDAPGGAVSAAPAAEQGAYVTTSGRCITITAAQLARVPTAEKRRIGVRVGVVAVFIAVVLALVVGLALLVGNLIKELETSKPDPNQVIQQQAQQTITQALGYDPDANPFTLTEPNLMGVPVDKATVLVVDASAGNARQFDYLKALIPHNLKALNADTPVQVLLIHDGKVVALPEQVTPAGQLELAALTDKIESIYPAGELRVVPAVEQALAASPGQIIVLLGSGLPVGEPFAALAEKLRSAAMPFHVLLLGASDDALRQTAEGTAGQYVELPRGQIGAWFEKSR